jgi:hypothetical protein
VTGARAFSLSTGVLFAGGGNAALKTGLQFQPRQAAYVFHPATSAGGSHSTTPAKAFNPTRAGRSTSSVWTGLGAWIVYAAVLALLALLFIRRRRATTRGAAGP